MFTTFLHSDTNLKPASSIPPFPVTRKVTFSSSSLNLHPPHPAPTDFRSRFKSLDALLEPSPALCLSKRSAPLAPDLSHLLRRPSSSSSTTSPPQTSPPPCPFPSLPNAPTLLPTTFSTAGLPPGQYPLRHGSTIQILPPRALSDITSSHMSGDGGDIVLDLSKRKGFVYLCSGDSQQIAVFRRTYSCSFSAAPAPLILINPVATYTRSDFVRLGREAEGKEHLRAHRLVGKAVQVLHSRRVLLSFLHTLFPQPGSSILAHHLPLDLKVTIYAGSPPSYSFLYRPPSSSHSPLTGFTSFKIHVSPLTGTAHATLSSGPPYSRSLSHDKIPAPFPSTSTRSYSFPLAPFLSSPASTPSSPNEARAIDRVLSHLSLPLSSLSSSVSPSSVPASSIARDLVARVLEFALGEDAENLVDCVWRAHLGAVRAVETRSGARGGRGGGGANDRAAGQVHTPSLDPASQPRNPAPQDVSLPTPSEPLEAPERALLRRLEQVVVGLSPLFSSRSKDLAGHTATSSTRVASSPSPSSSSIRRSRRSEGPDERRCEPGLGWISRRFARACARGRTTTVEYEILFSDGEEVRLILSGWEGMRSEVGSGEVDRSEIWWKGRNYSLDEPLPSSLRRRLPLVGEMLHLFLPL
ncbi:hypothetical protein JCM21900_000245 [Sporobolomyces salmonicolor]